MNHVDRKPGVRLVTDRPAHKGYPGTVRVDSDIAADGRCAHTGVKVPECSCLPCLERLYRLGAA